MKRNRSEEEVKELIELYKEGKVKFNKYEKLEKDRAWLMCRVGPFMCMSDQFSPTRKQEKEKKYKEEVELYEKKEAAINKVKIENFLKNWGRQIKIHLSFYEGFLFDTPSSELKQYYLFEYQLSFLYKLLEIEINSPITWEYPIRKDDRIDAIGRAGKDIDQY